MATLLDIKNLVIARTRVNTGSQSGDITDNDIVEAINNAIKDIVGFADEYYLQNIKKRIYSATKSLNSYGIDLDSDFAKTKDWMKIHSSTPSDTEFTERRMKYVNLGDLLNIEKGLIFDIGYYSYDNSQFVFDEKTRDHIDDNSITAFTVTYTYVPYPAAISLDTDTFPLPAYFINPVVSGVSGFIFSRIGDIENYQGAMAEWQRAMVLYSNPPEATISNKGA